MLRNPRAALLDCPCCGGAIEVSEYACPNCDVRISGTFMLSDTIFDELSSDDLDDLRLLVMNGAPKAMGSRCERISNLKNRILAWLTARSHEISTDAHARRKEILDAMKAGEMDPTEARKQLRALAEEDAAR